MTVKQWLQRGYRLNVRINELIEKKQRAFESATGAAIGSELERVQTSRSNTSEDRFINYAAYEELIDREIDELYAVKLEIHAEIGHVGDPILNTLLSMRYEEFMTWDAIAGRLGYSVRHTTRLHKKALRKMEEIGGSER